MNRYAIEQKFKSAAAFLIILILLPYIVSVFVNGTDLREVDGGVFYVKVKIPETEEADGVTELNWTDYLAGILAKEISKDRLIIMVTHNPNLAEKYSSRIIRLLDGNITDDTNPYHASEKDIEKAKNKKEKYKKKVAISFTPDGPEACCCVSCLGPSVKSRLRLLYKQPSPHGP